jgi:hypothetical protein
VLALVDDVEELLLETVEFLLVEVGIQVGLGLVEQLAPLAVFHEAEELLVLRMAHLHLEHLAGGWLGRSSSVAVGLFEQLLGFGDDLDAEAHLIVDQAIDAGLEAGEGLFALDRGGTGDDQRGARLVDEDGVDFVNDAVPVVTLHLVLLARGHAVVAEVVEAELAGGAVGDVAGVHLAAQVGRHLLLDAAHGHAEEPVEVPHPLGVAAGEVVVDGDELGVLAGEGVEVERQRGDEGLAFAGRHFGSCPGGARCRR